MNYCWAIISGFIAKRSKTVPYGYFRKLILWLTVMHRGTVRQKIQNKRNMCILKSVAFNESQLYFDFHILLLKSHKDFKHFY